MTAGADKSFLESVRPNIVTIVIVVIIILMVSTVIILNQHVQLKRENACLKQEVYDTKKLTRVAR